MTQVTVFSTEQSAIVEFMDKKGNTHAITPQGALFKGGEALKSLKDAACDSAFRLAQAGRFRPASDILCVAFPSIGKAAESLIGTPWANKSSFATLVNAVLRAEPKAGKDFSAKQRTARALAVDLDTVLNPVVEQAESTATV